MHLPVAKNDITGCGTTMQEQIAPLSNACGYEVGVMLMPHLQMVSSTAVVHRCGQ